MYFWTKSRTEQETIGTRRDEFVLFILKYIFHWEKLEKCVVFVWPFVMNHKYDGHQQELFYSNHGLPCAIWVFLLNLFKWKLQIGTTSIRIWIFISLKTVHNDVIDTSIYYSSFMSVVYDTLKTFNNFFFYSENTIVPIPYIISSYASVK